MLVAAPCGAMVCSTVETFWGGRLGVIHPGGVISVSLESRVMLTSDFGSYLRLQRAATQPGELGLRSYGSRRVSGLRREEVASTAGISVDYYARLEQGREKHPSAQVLEALARIFMLTDDEKSHLYRLAGLEPPLALPAGEVAAPRLARLIGNWPSQPALILNSTYDVLARNHIADSFFSGFTISRNLVAKVFLDPEAKTFYRDWEQVAEYSVAALRLAQGVASTHARVGQIVRKLVHNSTEFEVMWQKHQVRSKTQGAKRFMHPEVGEVTLDYETLHVGGMSGQQLLIYHAEPDSPSADALELLGSLRATNTANPI